MHVSQLCFIFIVSITNQKNIKMSKSRSFKYRVKMSYVSFTAKKRAIATFVWDSKKYGRPTLENLKKFRAGMNSSINEKDGTNTHLRGTQSNYGKAWIETNVERWKTPETIVEFNPPMFEEI